MENTSLNTICIVRAGYIGAQIRLHCTIDAMPPVWYAILRMPTSATQRGGKGINSAPCGILNRRLTLPPNECR